jgi:hypothetical protein
MLLHRTPSVGTGSLRAERRQRVNRTNTMARGIFTPHIQARNAQFRATSPAARRSESSWHPLIRM